MVIRKEKSLIHWNYFLALQSDLADVSRYIEFDEANFETYSIELSHILLASASEVDVVVKGICKYLEPKSKAGNINGYWDILSQGLPEFLSEKVYVPRFNLSFRPWKYWKSENSPRWWAAYNHVKHRRSEYFSNANLQNVLNSVGGLLISVFYFYKLQFISEGIEIKSNRDVTDLLKDETSFMRLDDQYYRGHLLLA